jgi:hypothetical protein
MGKVCPLCKREQPKAAYNAKNNKKKKGKAAACNDCKAAGGDCVKLSAAGFALAGVPDDHAKAYYNGVYSKTEQIVNSRHVYSGPNEQFAWYSGGRWWLEEKKYIGTMNYCLSVKSLAASPGSIDNDIWEVVERHENGLVEVSMRGLTTTALNVGALAAAKVAASNAFDEAIEQAAPSFVLSGLDSNHFRDAMGVYERKDEREKVNGRFVYKGPSGMWAWSDDCVWCFGAQEGIGQDSAFVGVGSSAPAPESIATKQCHSPILYSCSSSSYPSTAVWQREGVKLHYDKLTTTAIYHKPADLFKGTCTFCLQCRQWRRCGKGGNEMYCSGDCQRAHLQQAGHDDVCLN